MHHQHSYLKLPLFFSPLHSSTCTVALCYVTPPVVNFTLYGKDAFLHPLVKAVYQRVSYLKIKAFAIGNFILTIYILCFLACRVNTFFIARTSLLSCVYLWGMDTNHVRQPWSTYLGSPQWNTVCLRFTTVAILDWFWWHVGLCGAFTREDNCIACTSCGDITWDMFEANVAKEKLRQRKWDKVSVARSCLMSSVDSVSMLPDSAEEEGLDSSGCESSFSTLK